ncbi:UvrD-helicase domain-containing protein [Hornefia butyriciproducens]|uniref:DNA 3'-5' helicase n=1 Tax=Hornefia butyriciproducens TaxID=2652293 RepID=A0A6L5Y8E8_9FIRM|nr:UvrD-helicase domain-containing protein [Hornefia butyriciproducens]MST52785.1 AAA family ATPase [Hornefia butyriciproducens]
MAKMIDHKPNLHGEAKLWSCLESYLPNDTIVYHNREVNGREFDFCLFMENYGVLVIEVKGWQSDKICVNGIDEIVVEGYDKPQRSPKKQARAYRFALLNKIVEKHNVSPLVFDMVCYPFISEAEYKNKRLDIVSEEKFTIFKEDLDNQEQLLKKIFDAYNASKIIPHAELTKELVLKLRRDWEANLEEDKQPIYQKSMYSILSTHLDSIDGNDIEIIINEYFAGVKRILFIKEFDSYKNLIAAFNQAFKKKNIDPQGNSLELGYHDGLSGNDNFVRAFNLELYYVPKLDEICIKSISIIEGECGVDEKQILLKLASVTSFNAQQYSVEHASTSENVLVEAGAGTGKTFSMVSRVAYLCNKKTDSISNLEEEIALVTFTNDAANNMKARLKQMFVNYFILTGDPRYLKFIEDTDRAHISTIHSFALDIIRKSSLYTGLGTKFRIASNEYLRSKIYDLYLSQFLAEMEEENENFANEIPVPVYDLKKKIIGIADKLLNKSINLNEIRTSEMGVPVENSLPYFNQIIEKVIVPSEKEYMDSVHLNNDIDLKECIILLNEILKNRAGKLEDLKIRYLFIDEFQDTDDVQIRVFQKLQKAMNSECRLFVVGDLKQSIYRFRGARLSAFKQLQADCLYDWQVFHLNINYRTDGRLLELYDDVFQGMGAQDYLPYSAEDQLTSNVNTDIDDNELFVMIPCHGKEEDTLFDAFIGILLKQESLLRQQLKQKKLSRAERTIAVLVRSNWQVEKLVEAGRKKGIRIDTRSGGDLFQLESTQDLYKLVLALCNNDSSIHLVNFIESNYVSLSLDYQYYRSADSEIIKTDLSRILDEFFSVRMGKSWQKIVDEAYTQPVLYVLKQLYDALEPWKHYSRNPDGQRYYMANYEYLLERIIKYSRIESLTLNQIAEYLKINILTRQQQLAREISVDDEDIQFLCTTIHGSKGLEYGTVILPYTDDDISDIKKVKLDANYSESKLSYTVTFDNKVREKNSYYDEMLEVNEQIAEESRILYVALTRAIRNCVWINNLDRNTRISWKTLLEG